MNAITLLDGISTLGFLAAFFYALRLPSTRVAPVPKLFFSVCVLLYVIIGISNVLEHSGVTSYMERHYEDYLEILSLPFFLFFLYSLSMWREMEARKVAESRLAYSEKYLRSIIDAEPESVKLMTAEGVLLSLNKAGLDMIGAEDSAMVVGKPLSGIVAPEHLDAFKEFMQRVLDGGRETLKLKIVGLGGAERWVESHAVPFRDEIEKRTLILAVTRDVTERVKADERIRSSLMEKEILLREIHHRVKNNMQIISSLLNLQARQAKSPEDNGLFRDSQNRIRTMALVHEELYGSADLSNIPFGDYVGRLANNLRSSYSTGQDIAIDMQVPPITIGIETAIPLGLVINELVSNCLKHAFPEGRGGKVGISMASADGMLELTVADDGAGLPEGYDFRAAETMGHQLVATLVEHQLHGTVRVSREGGTAFIVRCREAGSSQRR